jgi:hypothetical protein
MDWIKLAQNSDQERNCVETVKNRDVQWASGACWLATAVSAAENEDEGVTDGRYPVREATQPTNQYI